MTEQEAKALWDRALTSINTADLALSTDPDSAASRAYYAAFYAISALFAGRDVLINSHDGINILLNRDYIKTGILSKEIGKRFKALRKDRSTGDYGILDRVSADSAQADITSSKAIIEAVFLLHPDQFSRPAWLKD